ncbi:MCP four helix bundle domain-containing protein [Runella sp.]|uniref:MCP four helix bundle domain-containing protein n=1 Tax=Runella sp. TaxID=1960881 RepID=UPI003D0CAE57
MKWAYSLQQKLKIAVLLTVVFGLLFVKNLLDKQNFTELGEAFSTVYEDRLLAESYIYKFYHHLSEKKIMIDGCTSYEDISHIKSQISRHNKAINTLIHEFEKTKLTPAEAVVFYKFKAHVAEDFRLEQRYFYQIEAETEISSAKKTLGESFYTMSNDLDHLSNIQISEGEKLNDSSRKIVLGSANQNRFELSLLIVLGILIHVLIFASKSTLPKTPQNPSLN